jgi:glycosyltransferase involved in cell wall biosynthesis
MFAYATDAAKGRKTIVRYAPPGVDTARYAPAPNRNPAQGHILTVGRLDDPRKNIELLLEAYARLVNGLPSAPDLILAGASGPGPAFWSKAEELGLAARVRFVEKPSTPELVRLYREAAMFVSSSDEEGFGYVVVEAMACGIPVVSTRSGGPDGIITDGVDGLLVDLNDADGLADRMGRLLRDVELNAQMGRSARITADQRYSEQAASAAFLAVYQDVIGNAAP